VVRERQINTDGYSQQIGHFSKTETCVLYPNLPKAWLANGFIIVPSLSEKGVKGHFEVEVYSSESIKLTPLPESYSRMIAGEWVEANAGGCHLSSLTFKKNPKFVLKLKKPGYSRKHSITREEKQHIAEQIIEPVKTRISISRVGTNWKSMMKKDTVGCMIGFYIFIRRSKEYKDIPVLSASSAVSGQNYEMTQIYESVFNPDHEACTEDAFVLPYLGSDEEYIVQPTTFGDAKIGAFIISVSSESEFSFTAEKRGDK